MFQADTENVQCSVYIAIMRSKAVRTSPMPHSKRAHTFRTASGDRPAARTRLGTPSFVGLYKSRPVPFGLVAELMAERRPAGIQDGLSHLGFCQLGSAHIADDDQLIRSGDLARPLVQMMLSRIGDLGVDCFGPALVSRPLGNGQSLFVFSVVAKCWNLNAIRARRQCLEAEVDADFAIASSEIVWNLTLKDNVPATARVFDKRSALNVIGNFAGFPEEVSALEVDRARTVNANGTRDKRNPAELALWTEASAEFRAFSLAVTRNNELAADCLDGIGVDAKSRASPGTKLDQVKRSWPAHRKPRLPSPLCFPLRGNAEVPDLIARNGVSTQMFSGRGILDAKLKRKDAHMRCSVQITVARRSVCSARDRHSSYSTPCINQAPLLPAMNDGVSAWGETR